MMLPSDIERELVEKIANADHPRELVVDVMMAIQSHYGYLSDSALKHTAYLLDMTPLEVEEVATFYTFIYREPVGQYIIHLCDSLVCWMNGVEPLRDYLCRLLGIGMGETTSDGLFTLLPVCCLGYCDRSPAILINKKVYGELTAQKLDNILDNLRREAR